MGAYTLIGIYVTVLVAIIFIWTLIWSISANERLAYILTILCAAFAISTLFYSAKQKPEIDNKPPVIITERR